MVQRVWKQNGFQKKASCSCPAHFFIPLKNKTHSISEKIGFWQCFVVTLASTRRSLSTLPRSRPLPPPAVFLHLSAVSRRKQDVPGLFFNFFTWKLWFKFFVLHSAKLKYARSISSKISDWKRKKLCKFWSCEFCKQQLKLTKKAENLKTNKNTDFVCPCRIRTSQSLNDKWVAYFVVLCIVKFLPLQLEVFSFPSLKRTTTLMLPEAIIQK